MMKNPDCRSGVIIFYGDSNTFGYDPRGYFGGRYDEDVIWTSRVAAALGGGWTVRNEGMNGRCLPANEYGFQYIDELLDGLREEDLFAVMLGTNDLLGRSKPDAQIPVKRMEGLLEHLSARSAGPKVLVIAPPLAGGGRYPDPELRPYFEENRRMNAGFRRLAERYGVWFVDAAEWDVELAYDGVHFSEDGHRQFAEQLILWIEA